MDLDGDGIPDLISGSWPGELFFFRGKGKGHFDAPIKLKDKNGKTINVGGGLQKHDDMILVAGDAKYEVRGTWTAGYDAHLLSVIPHMHWLGKDFLLEAVLPDGTRRTLIKIDDWDFNWQGTYEFSNAVAIPKGTKIEMAAHFDNSQDNPRNPSKPPVEVHWGEQTTDEMCIGFLQLTRDDERLENRAPVRFRSAASKKTGVAAKE